MDRASEAAKRLLSVGLGFRRLSVAETIALEPALTPIANQLTGSIYYAIDETGDAHRFCTALATSAQGQGVQFRFDTEVSSLEMRSGRVVAAVSHGERFVVDRYIVAAGSYSMPILRWAGMALPVRPVKGYSVTFDCPADGNSPHVPIVDDHFHAVVGALDIPTEFAP